MRLSALQPDGCTLRDHLEVAARRTGDWSELALPELSPGSVHLWNTFQEIASGRPPAGGLGGGHASIPPSEVYAWQQLTGVRLTPWEYETILALDRVTGAVVDEQRASANKGKQ